jgi:hypothetical protein
MENNVVRSANVIPTDVHQQVMVMHEIADCHRFDLSLIADNGSMLFRYLLENCPVFTRLLR